MNDHSGALIDLGQGPGFSTGQQHADALMCHLWQCQARDATACESCSFMDIFFRNLETLVQQMAHLQQQSRRLRDATL